MIFKYGLKFVSTALKEWKKLDRPIQLQFKKKLEERLEQPHVPSSKLHGFPNHYKIKLRASGYRLVYKVEDKEICVIVIAVGKREKLKVYRKASKRRESE